MERSNQPDVLVVGAGAAGIVAAWRAATVGARVTLLEKNDRIGIKILISGGGKCNITHDGPIEDLLHAFRPNEARFLRPSCYRFTNRDIVGMLTSRGLEVYTRPDGRIFPVNGTAKDVVAILQDYLEQARVRIKLNAAVTGVDWDDGALTGVRLGGGRIPCSQLILSSGGSSYPKTGTTGDAWPWVKKMGHKIVKVRAALAPIILDPAPPTEWAGVALRDCLLRARQDDKTVARRWGDILFTHHGISGPAVLEISREVTERREHGAVSMEVDLTPDQPFEELRESYARNADAFPRRRIREFVDRVAPGRLVNAIMDSAGVERAITGAHLSARHRNQLVSVLKGWNLGNVQRVPIEKGEVVAGGVALDEVDPQTMRSHLIGGLYLCGEMLDVAGPVGGYNLQGAFSTGYVAGETAARDAANGSL